MVINQVINQQIVFLRKILIKTFMERSAYLNWTHLPSEKGLDNIIATDRKFMFYYTFVVCILLDHFTSGQIQFLCYILDF